MKLSDLDAEFIGNYQENPHQYEKVESIDDAQGVIFQCPLCARGKEAGQDEDGRRYFVGAHYIICWFANPRKLPKVPDSASPKPGRWNISKESTSIDNLTFCGPGSFSVLLTSGCGWHGFVSNGNAE